MSALIPSSCCRSRGPKREGAMRRRLVGSKHSSFTTPHMRYSAIRPALAFFARLTRRFQNPRRCHLRRFAQHAMRAGGIAALGLEIRPPVAHGLAEIAGRVFDEFCVFHRQPFTRVCNLPFTVRTS